MTQDNTSSAVQWTAWPLHKMARALIINDIWPEMLFFTGVAAMVSLVSDLTTVSLAVSSQMLTVLGIVLGLVVSFRTTSAYDRYWEGRKLWTTINITSRNIAHMIWIHIPNERPSTHSTIDTNARADRLAEMRGIIEKKTMINLIQAFAVAVKHMLRGEPGIYYRDLYPLVCFLPKYTSGADKGADNLHTPLWDESLQGKVRRPILRRTKSTGDLEQSKSEGYFQFEENEFDGFNPEEVLPQIKPEGVILRRARNRPRPTIYDYIPLLVILKPLIAVIKYPINKLRQEDGETPDRGIWGRKKRPAVVSSNVPFEIALYLSSYFAWLQKQGLVPSSVASALITNINMLHDLIANMNRIRNTPIPFAYQAHLRMSMWLYLFFLPFQVYSAFGYYTILATAFASFLLLGFLEIGQEIEDPFGYDLNDLDLDFFCLNIQRELHEITAHPVPSPDSYIFGPDNQPFAPTDRQSAKVLLESKDSEYLDAKKGQASMHKTLLKNWKEVLDKTVEKR